MRTIGNCLSDPTLHLLSIVLLLAFLTFGGGLWSQECPAETPLAYCKTCHLHFMPGKTCGCPAYLRFANSTP